MLNAGDTAEVRLVSTRAIIDEERLLSGAARRKR